MLAFGMFFLLTLHILYTKCKQEEHSYYRDIGRGCPYEQAMTRIAS